MQQGKADAARTAYERVLALEPGSADAHLNLCNVLIRLAQPQDALKHYRRAAELAPGHPGAHINEGAALLSQGRVAEAVESFRRAAALAPQSGKRSSILQTPCSSLAKQTMPKPLTGARWCCSELRWRASRARQPQARAGGIRGSRRRVPASSRAAAGQRRSPQQWNRTGRPGPLREAEAEYRSALAIQPELVDVYRNLGRLVLAQGDAAEALRLGKTGTRHRGDDRGQSFFRRIRQEASRHAGQPEFRTLVVRAVAEGWSRPSELAGLAPKLFALNDVARSCLDRAVRAWPQPLTETELFEGNGLAVIASDSAVARVAGVGADPHAIEL